MLRLLFLIYKHKNAFLVLISCPYSCICNILWNHDGVCLQNEAKFLNEVSAICNTITFHHSSLWGSMCFINNTYSPGWGHCFEACQVSLICNFVWHIGGLHTESWIWVWCRSGIQIQRPLCLHTASIWIWSAYCSASQCSRTVQEIQFRSAMRVVCARSGTHTRTHWTRIGDPDPVNPVLVPVWRAPGHTVSKTTMWYS